MWEVQFCINGSRKPPTITSTSHDRRPKKISFINLIINPTAANVTTQSVARHCVSFPTLSSVSSLTRVFMITKAKLQQVNDVPRCRQPLLTVWRLLRFWITKKEHEVLYSSLFISTNQPNNILSNVLSSLCIYSVCVCVCVLLRNMSTQLLVNTTAHHTYLIFVSSD